MEINVGVGKTMCGFQGNSTRRVVPFLSLKLRPISLVTRRLKSVKVTNRERRKEKDRKEGNQRVHNYWNNEPEK